MLQEIGQTTGDIRFVEGNSNAVADVLSRPSDTQSGTQDPRRHQPGDQDRSDELSPHQDRTGADGPNIAIGRWPGTRQGQRIACSGH